MRAAGAPSGGPEGRQKQACHRPGFNKSSPHKAGVELACRDYDVRAAGRGVDGRICDEDSHDRRGVGWEVTLQRFLPSSRTSAAA